MSPANQHDLMAAALSRHPSLIAAVAQRKR
jgi:hypothetical protein